MLKKWQRNAVFQAIEAVGMSPEQFAWEQADDKSRLRHRPSGAYFEFGGVPGDYVSRYMAGDAQVEERSGLSQLRLMQQVDLWLWAVKRDMDTPDLWARLLGEAELLGAISGEAVANTPLSASEQQEIAAQLSVLTEHIERTYSLSEPQARLLAKKLDYLAAAASRVGRKDWLLIAAGLMLSYVLEAAIPPEAARDIFGTLLTSIGHSLGYGPHGLTGG